VLHCVCCHGSSTNHASDFKLGFQQRTGDHIRLNILPDECPAKVAEVLFHESPLISYAIQPSHEKKERNAEVTFGQVLKVFERVLLLLLLHLLQMQQLGGRRWRFLGSLHQDGPVFRDRHIAVKGRQIYIF